MNRRHFLRHAAFTASGLCLPSPRPKTKHLILVVGSGVRKKDYYEQRTLSPNICRLASEGFVFEEDHCERVASHETAFRELMQGRQINHGAETSPTILDYIPNGVHVDTLPKARETMERRRSRIVICRDGSHDAGHDCYQKYLKAVTAADAALGVFFDWVKRDPYFSTNTAIVIRPEFGRDDEVNEHGHLHHSCGFYYTHRVASIFWGPDFNRGVDKRTVVSSLDLAPTLARLFNVSTTFAQGRVLPGLFKMQTESIGPIALE